jgi:hypothetical protein
MPLTADQQFNALTADSTLEKITITATLAAPVDGMAITIGAGVVDSELFAVESMVGLFKQAEAYLLSEFVSLQADAGPGVVISVSIDSAGTIVRDNTSTFVVKVGANIADASRTHVIDAMFKLCIAKLLETGKDGYTPI